MGRLKSKSWRLRKKRIPNCHDLFWISKHELFKKWQKGYQIEGFESDKTARKRVNWRFRYPHISIIQKLEIDALLASVEKVLGKFDLKINKDNDYNT